MIENILKLYNRYGDNVYLEHLEGDEWILRGSEHTRIIFDKDPNDIKAIDPSGGPFLAEGKTLTRHKKKIVSISFKEGRGFVLKLKDLDETDKS